MHALLLLAAAGAPLSSPCPVSQSRTVREIPADIPFELESGHIFIEAFVDGGGPYRFGFDTGASGVGRVDAALASDRSLPVVDSQTNSDGVVERRVDVVAVRRLRVGNVEKSNVKLLSRDYNKGRPAGVKPLMGIIGRDFFCDRVITIDYPARIIRFSSKPLGKRAMAVPYGDGFAIPVCFATKCHPGKVDTGSSRSLVIPKDVVEKLAATPPVLVGTAQRTNSSVKLYRVTLGETVKISGVSIDGQSALYAEPSTDTINIGSDFLKDYVLTIDQRQRLLKIERPNAG